MTDDPLEFFHNIIEHAKNRLVGPTENKFMDWGEGYLTKCIADLAAALGAERKRVVELHNRFEIDQENLMGLAKQLEEEMAACDKADARWVKLEGVNAKLLERVAGLEEKLRPFMEWTCANCGRVNPGTMPYCPCKEESDE